MRRMVRQAGFCPKICAQMCAAIWFVAALARLLCAMMSRISHSRVHRGSMLQLTVGSVWQRGFCCKAPKKQMQFSLRKDNLTAARSGHSCIPFHSIPFHSRFERLLLLWRSSDLPPAEAHPCQQARSLSPCALPPRVSPAPPCSRSLRAIDVLVV